MNSIIMERMKKIIYIVRKFAEKVSDNYTAACAAQAAFFILLSIVPMLSFMLALTTYLPITQGDVLYLVMKVVPNEFYAYAEGLLNDLYSSASGAVISISVIAMLWSAARGIQALMDGLNRMYGLQHENGFFRVRALSLIYTFFILIIFVVLITVYVTGAHYYKEYVMDAFVFESTLRKVLLFLRYVMGWLLFYFFILMLYVILPGKFGMKMGKEDKQTKRARIKSQMPGAVFSSVAWIVITKLVGVYMLHFPAISIMYGSLAGIVIAMLWLYFCMYSIFIGAVINHLLSNRDLTDIKKMLK